MRSSVPTSHGSETSAPSISAAPAVRIGIDLGGTKIAAVALDRGGRQVFSKRVPTPSSDYAAIVQAIAQLVSDADTAAESLTPRGTASVGVGIPGSISPATGLVKNANTVCLIGNALDRDIAAAVARPVRLANDANCFALSEATDGAGADGEVVFGIILGTGTGGGLVVNKRVITGPNAIAGEWGHNPLPWPDPALGELPGPACYCGLKGCIETFLSGPGLARDGGSADAPTLVKQAAAGEPSATAAMARYVDRLARATATLINIIDPDVLVLGGGLSRVAQLYEAVPPLWPKYVLSDTVVTKLRPPAHGDASGVRGAAWLWP